MAWSMTAPSLPSGSSWVKKGTISISNSQFDVTGTVFFARLADRGFALKIVEKRIFHLTNPNFTDFYKTYHRCDVAGVRGEAYTESNFGTSGSTKTYYFTGVAEVGASIKVFVGVKEDGAGMQEISFTAPKLLGPSVYIKVGSAWKKASSVYARVNGAWKDAQVKINVDGTWK